MSGKIVHVESLGYFYLHILDRPFYVKHHFYGKVDSKVIVLPGFMPTSPNLIKFTKAFGESNLLVGLEMMSKYEDNLPVMVKREHEKIREMNKIGFPDELEEQEIINHYQSEIAKLFNKIDKLKREMAHELKTIRGENISGQ
jgi:hypothetical protein